MKKINKNTENAKKWSNTNEVVWDVIWTAMNPEKMFWTAEIELYRCVMSNGPYGLKKKQQQSIYFGISDHHNGTMLLTTIFLMFWVLEWLWKIKIGARKSFFVKILIKNIFFLNTTFFILAPNFKFFRFCFQSSISVHFSFLLHQFLLFCDHFLEKILPQINPDEVSIASKTW